MHYRFEVRGRVYEVVVERQGESYRATVDGQPYELEILDAQAGQLSLRFEDRPITLYWAANGSQKWVARSGCTYRLDKPSPRAARPTTDHDGGEAVRAPMPAQVRAVQVSEGEAVEQGQVLLLLEAMKMEIRIKAPSHGRVTRLPVKPGQAVDKDQVLAEIGE